MKQPMGNLRPTDIPALLPEAFRWSPNKKNTVFESFHRILVLRLLIDFSYLFFTVGRKYQDCAKQYIQFSRFFFLKQRLNSESSDKAAVSFSGHKPIDLSDRERFVHTETLP